MEKVTKECHHLLNKPCASGRVLAHLIDLITSTTPVILPAQLHYRGLQRLQNKALSQSQSYDLEIKLNEDTRKDPHFWICQIHLWNGRPITTPTAEVTITLPVLELGDRGHFQNLRSHQHAGAKSGLCSSVDVCNMFEAYLAVDQQSD